jgi:hypothetical protein
MIHLISYFPENRGITQKIEEPIKMRDVKISLRVDGKALKKSVYCTRQKIIALQS